MTLSILEPRPALIVVDLQQGIVGRPLVHPIRLVIERSATLARRWREHGLPVVLVTTTGVAPGRTDAQTAAPGPPPDLPSDFAELVPDLDARPSDRRVIKQRWGAFTTTELDGWLRSEDVTQVVLTGVATSIGVESTARSASELGYHVVVVTDAMTDRDAAAHGHTIGRIFPRLGEVATTEEVLTALDRGAGA